VSVVSIWRGHRGDRLEPRQGPHRRSDDGRGAVEADEFVICGGAWTADIARQLKLRLPMQAGKGYSSPFRGSETREPADVRQTVGRAGTQARHG